MSTTGSGQRPICPYSCPLCAAAMNTGGLSATPMHIVEFRTQAYPRPDNVAIQMVAVLAAGIIAFSITSLALQVLLVPPIWQLVGSVVSAFAGMVVAALIHDHLTGRRRLWRRHATQQVTTRGGAPLPPTLPPGLPTPRRDD